MNPNPSTAQARAVVDELVRNGVRELSLAPGSRSAALALAAASHEDMRVWTQIDERSAGFFAVGMAKEGHEPTAVLTTSGTAAANLYPAIVEADTSNTPLVVLTADRPPELRHAGANQTIDQVKLFGTSVRWFCELGVAEDRTEARDYWRSVVCRAVAEATGFRPGPIHINIPFREPLVPASDDGRSSAEPVTAEIDGRPSSKPWTAFHGPGIPEIPMPSEIAEVEKGIVVVGQTPLGGLERAERLAALLGWPLIAEPTSGGRPVQSITTAHHLFSARHPALAPQAAVVFGRAGLSRSLTAALGDANIVVVDPYGWADPGRSASAIIGGWPVLEGPVTRAGTWRRLFLQLESSARGLIDQLLDSHILPTEPRMARDAALATPSGGALVAGSSMPIRDLDWFMGPNEARIVSNRGASGIDGWVSVALGVATRRPVVALGGDLSLLYDSNGLAVRDRPGCVFVCVNNDGGGIFSFLPQAGYENFETLFAAPRGFDLEHLARLHGLGFVRIGASDELIPAVAAGIAAGGVHLLEVRTERSRNIQVHEELTAAVADLIRDVLG